MRLDRPLDDLFGGPSHVSILRTLVDLPGGLERSIRDIARRSGLSHPTASRVLHDLATLGIATVRRVPPAEYFGLSSEHVLTPVLRAAFAAEARVLDELRAVIRTHLAATSAEAWIFGSAARDSMRADSDVDIAVATASGTAALMDQVLEGLQETLRVRFGVRASFLVGEGTFDDLLGGESDDGVWHQVQREGVAV